MTMGAADTRWAKSGNRSAFALSITLAAVFLILLVYLLVICFYYYEFSGLKLSGSAMPISFSISGNTYNFSAYAWNQSEEFQGLMNATVTNSTFMVFNVGNSGLCPQVGETCPFWMKNTPYALDIIWLNISLDGIGRVVYFADAQPYNATQNSKCDGANLGTALCPFYTPSAYANYVVETWQGFGAATGLHVGEEVKFNYK